jgi:hypothetical protein
MYPNGTPLLNYTFVLLRLSALSAISNTALNSGVEEEE